MKFLLYATEDLKLSLKVINNGAQKSKPIPQHCYLYRWLVSSLEVGGTVCGNGPQVAGGDPRKNTFTLMAWK